MIPEAEIRIMCAMTNPPQPRCAEIVTECGETIAVVRLEQLKRAYEQLVALEVAKS